MNIGDQNWSDSIS